MYAIQNASWPHAHSGVDESVTIKRSHSVICSTSSFQHTKVMVGDSIVLSSKGEVGPLQNDILLLSHP